jgi:pimeloyl-ACP methyl ester carboxylesterase
MTLASILQFLGLGGRVPAANGPHAVASVHYRVPQGTLSQIFYPTNGKEQLDPEAGRLRRKSYRPEVISGTSMFSKTPRWLLGAFLDLVPHPLASTTPLEGRFPVIVFSHGLGGSCDYYSKACSDMAAHGFIVVALEHEDGSASYAAKQDGHEIEYRSPPINMQYTRSEVINFRKPFLEHRVGEVRSALAFLKTATTQPDVPENIRLVLKMADTSNFFVGGHSFGAASSVESARLMTAEFKGAILLDLWPFPLSEESIDHGVTLPCISILSQPFSVSTEARYTRRLLSGSPDHSSFKIMGACHSSFSDTPWWFPAFIGRRADLRGSADPLLVQSNVNDLNVSFLRSVLDKNQGLSQEQVAKLTRGMVELFDCSNGEPNKQLAQL